VAEHAEGPWHWEYLDGRPIALVSCPALRDVLVATGDSERSWADVSEADARLIASAPYLLTACQAALDLLEHGDFSNGVRHPYGYADEGEVKARELIDAIRTVVTEAVGQPSPEAAS
jgi:hypothetical protein